MAGAIGRALPEGIEAKLTAVIVQQGKLLDFIDGITQRNETPEEYVRQEIAKSLVREAVQGVRRQGFGLYMVPSPGNVGDIPERSENTRFEGMDGG